MAPPTKVRWLSLRSRLDDHDVLLLRLLDLGSSDRQKLEVELALFPGLQGDERKGLLRRARRSEQVALGVVRPPLELDLGQRDVRQVLDDPLDVEMASRADVQPRIEPGVEAYIGLFYLDLGLQVLGLDGFDRSNHDRERDHQSDQHCSHDPILPRGAGAATG